MQQNWIDADADTDGMMATKRGKDSQQDSEDQVGK